MKPSIPFHPEVHAVFDSERMGKTTLFESERLLVGLNAFEPGQEHKLHAHSGMDKVYHVLAGSGVFLLAGRAEPMVGGNVILWPPRGKPASPHSRTKALQVGADLAASPGRSLLL